MQSSFLAFAVLALALPDGTDLYHPRRDFPKLLTPQWIADDGVDAAVILAIDDMRDPVKYEAFLRPILNRLKRIDGRAPVSIMTCSIDPKHSQLQAWLKEGMSLETHTFDHPCPLLQKGDFEKAKSTYDRCVDLLATVPPNRPTAFRMPCCDSLNTPSPRFYAEIFDRKTAGGNFLTIDSSVFNVFTSNDPALPRELVIDADGQDRFRKYVPRDRSFVNTIENYPYPYVVGNLCWQFPCLTPSDWQAQYLHQPNNPVTVRDWKAALDCTVIKQGVLCLVFHPWGWIQSEQIVDFIDHAVEKHGTKVKFLTFREAQDRLDRFMLDGHPIRSRTGADNGVRIIDVNSDGYMDVVIGNERARLTRVWNPRENRWDSTEFPCLLSTVAGDDSGVRFDKRGHCLVRNEAISGHWRFVSPGGWQPAGPIPPVATSSGGRDRGVRLLNITGQECIVVANENERAVYTVDEAKRTWVKLPWQIPDGFAFVDADGKDAGGRLIDVDEDGILDAIWSNEKGSGLYLAEAAGWTHKCFHEKRGEKNALPAFVNAGQNMGAWVHSRHIWWQNEHTSHLPNHVDRRSFAQLLGDEQPRAKSPAASLRSIQTRPGFKVELSAAEPLVHDPVSFAWGPDGKFWVVEMGDYPQGTDGKGKPGGKVKFLESSRGDGTYDKATVFLDGLPFPTAVAPWHNGVVVTAAPDIFYAEDTDGDGRADKKEILFTGFTEGNQQHRVNSLVWGLDNWIYCANGDSGGQVKSLKTGQVVNIRGRDFRIRPDTGEIDLQMGQTQYGRARDDWGNWFGNNNINPMYHFALEDHYLRRNPHVPHTNARVNVSVKPGVAPVFPISRTLERFNDFHTANHFTSACSAIVYRDDLFGPHFSNNTFVCEPVHNLIHREIMKPTATTFTSQRAIDEQKSEFLASSDSWFRPAWIQTGPDGALWIADMYRHVIEHPEWIPKQWQKKLDLRAGHDMGRIYRVFPVGSKPRQIPRLDKMSPAELVAALDSPNGWQRDMAQQMLIWQNDKTTVVAVKRLALHSERPLTRLHALCTLDGLAAIDSEVLAKALDDPHPGIRRHAVRLSTPSLIDAANLSEKLARLVDDADPHVRQQLAYTLGEFSSSWAAAALVKLAFKNADDRFISAATISSVNRNNLASVINIVHLSTPIIPPPPRFMEHLLRMSNAFGDEKSLVALLKGIGGFAVGSSVPWRLEALAGLLDALEQRNTSLSHLAARNDELKESVQNLDELFAAARSLLNDPEADKIVAVRVLGRGRERQKEDVELLATLLTPRNSDDLQSAAIAALARLREPHVPELLLRGWRTYGPAMRENVLDALLRRDEWITALLENIERKALTIAEVDARRRQLLLSSKDPMIRDRATRLFAGAVDGDRQKVVESYRSALSAAGDSHKGREVFIKNCSACHRLGDLGHHVGPDLAGVGDKSPHGLVVAILDPNRAVDARYVDYTAHTRNGQQITGVLAAEDSTSVTLLGQNGKRDVLLRTDLEDLVSTSKSPMPDGMEKEIDLQAMTHLIAFVRSATPQPRRREFDGNKPEIVKAGADGVLLLTAKNCEIFGRMIEFERKHGNLGHWNDEEDRAVWTVDVPKTGKYSVTLEWACPKVAAGKTFLLEAGPNHLTGTVQATDNWDTYVQAKVGEIVLAAGQQRITMRSAEHISSPLFDLKSVKLVREDK